MASLISPILSGLAIYMYQTISHADFWNSEHKSEFSNFAGATMLAGETIQLLLALIVGFLIGLILALRSLYIKRSKTGVIALTLNTLPLAYLVFALIKL